MLLGILGTVLAVVSSFGTQVCIDITAVTTIDHFLYRGRIIFAECPLDASFLIYYTGDPNLTIVSLCRSRDTGLKPLSCDRYRVLFRGAHFLIGPLFASTLSSSTGTHGVFAC